MSKIGTGLLASLAFSWVMLGHATGVSAARPVCKSCGPIAPSIYYQTKRPAKYVTRFRDVSVYNRVQRVHRVMDVTRVQPIIHVREVTRVHHHTIVQTRTSHEYMTLNVAPIRYVERSVQNYYDCSCKR